MRHIIVILQLLVLSFVLSLGQFFITGIYGRIVFLPLLACFLISYLIHLALRGEYV